jgi:hypothetical protein
MSLILILVALLETFAATGLAQAAVGEAPAVVAHADLRASLTQAEQKRLARVILRNQPLLGARPSELCAPDDTACNQAVNETPARVTGPVEILAIRVARNAGLEWPGNARLKNARRVEVRVVFARGPARAHREIPLLVFTLVTDDKEAACIFPVEHWEWSDMTLPQRFAMAPIGICDEQEISVTELLQRILAPEATPWAIRFLSREESRAWSSNDPSALRRESLWNPGYPYAKYFFLESMRWWRGGDGRASDAHAAALRLPALPLADVQKLSSRGDAFLDLYEDGAQIEFTIVSRAGLIEVLSWPREALTDTSPADATVPRLVPTTPAASPGSGAGESP